MNKEKVIHEMGLVRVLPVIRTSDHDHAKQMADAVVRGGCTIVEITLTIPSAPELIGAIAESQPDVRVGAGTVSSVDQAKSCIDAGAKFIVSPWIQADLIRFCNDQDIVVIAGALTPTEIRSADLLGADLVKVFPIEAMGGTSYIRALKSVMPEVALIPTGGVTLANAAAFLDAGAFAVGIGSDLIKVNDLKKDEMEAAISRVNGLLARVRPLSM